MRYMPSLNPFQKEYIKTAAIFAKVFMSASSVVRMTLPPLHLSGLLLRHWVWLSANRCAAETYAGGMVTAGHLFRRTFVRPSEGYVNALAPLALSINSRDSRTSLKAPCAWCASKAATQAAHPATHIVFCRVGKVFPARFVLCDGTWNGAKPLGAFVFESPVPPPPFRQPPPKANVFCPQLKNGNSSDGEHCYFNA